MSKTEAVLFSKSYQQRLSKQLREAKIKLGNRNISFNKEATRWLGVWLNSQLKFISHINKRIQKAWNAEIQIKGQMQMRKIVPDLVRWIELAIIQSNALYGTEL